MTINHLTQCRQQLVKCIHFYEVYQFVITFKNQKFCFPIFYRKDVDY